MSEKKEPSDVAMRDEADGGTAAPEPPEPPELVDLGRASERTRGSFTGFVVESSSFPLYE